MLFKLHLQISKDLKKGWDEGSNVWMKNEGRCGFNSLISCDIVLMLTNVINLLNRVPEHNCLTFFVLHRTKCK